MSTSHICQSFDETLHNKIERKRFKDFLKEKHTSHHLEFIEKSIKYANTKRKHHRKKKGKFIYRLFIVDDAEKQINISGKVRGRIEDLVREKDWRVDLFEECVNSVKRDMMHDSFMSFHVPKHVAIQKSNVNNATMSLVRPRTDSRNEPFVMRKTKSLQVGRVLDDAFVDLTKALDDKIIDDLILSGTFGQVHEDADIFNLFREYLKKDNEFVMLDIYYDTKIDVFNESNIQLFNAYCKTFSSVYKLPCITEENYYEILAKVEKILSLKYRLFKRAVINVV
eukprot:TRINITY_DN11574_c0_g1_i1.p1 TRINITY_DN11574_c0_g1~~TRINITY_DN11574_c0_g1_i1.p1  ORF type:complete len:281 (-),score=46.74 TRINITY_DN11574_c0_g1_i1:107-949(-)